MLSSGSKANPKFRTVRIDDNNDCIELQKSVVKTESVVTPAKKKLGGYQPIYRHPLPVSKRRYQHEMTLKRVMSSALEKQAFAAVTLGDAWTLEEVIMRGAPIDVRDQTGYSPLHLAVQYNNFECIMVLINAGIDLNATTLTGITPLYLAKAARAKQATILLEESGARLTVENKYWPPGSTILDYEPPTKLPLFPPIGRPSAMRMGHASY